MLMTRLLYDLSDDLFGYNIWVCSDEFSCLSIGRESCGTHFLHLRCECRSLTWWCSWHSMEDEWDCFPPPPPLASSPSCCLWSQHPAYKLWSSAHTRAFPFDYAREMNEHAQYSPALFQDHRCEHCQGSGSAQLMFKQVYIHVAIIWCLISALCCSL